LTEQQNQGVYEIINNSLFNSKKQLKKLALTILKNIDNQEAALICSTDGNIFRIKKSNFFSSLLLTFAAKKDIIIMFTINPYLKFALIAVSIIGGIILALEFGFWYAFPFLLIGLVLLVGYIILGTISPAAKAMQAGDFDKSEKLLKLTLTPRLLYSTNRAYFYMIKGSIALARKNVDEGEMWMKKAESVKVPTDNERAMLQLQLANINASKNKWNKAKMHYKNAKSMKISDSNIKEQLKQFEKVLSNRGQMKAANQQGQGRFGNKRRRPKMR